MILDDQDKYYFLDYTHTELVALLEKIKNNEVLNPEQYDLLINQIGLENISTFDLDYYKLKNRPVEIVRTTQLINDASFIDAKQLQELLDTVIKPNIEKLDLAVEDLEDIKRLDIMALLEDVAYIEEELDETEQKILTLNDFTIDYRINLENLSDALNDIQNYTQVLNMQDSELEKNIEGIKSLIAEKQVQITELRKFVSYLEENQLKNTEKLKEAYKEHKSMREYVSFLVGENGYYERLNKLELEVHGMDLSQFATVEELKEFNNKIVEAIDKYQDVKEDIETHRDDIIKIFDQLKSHSDESKEIKDMLSTIKDYYDIIASEYEQAQVKINEALLFYNTLDDATIKFQIERLNGELNKIEDKIKEFDVLTNVVPKHEYEKFVNEQKNLNIETSANFVKLEDEIEAIKSIDHSIYLKQEVFDGAVERVQSYVNAINDRLNESDQAMKDLAEDFEEHNHNFNHIKENDQIAVAEMIAVARSYYDNRYKEDGSCRFEYSPENTPMGQNFQPGDGAIDNSAFINMIIRGLPIYDSPYKDSVADDLKIQAVEYNGLDDNIVEDHHMNADGEDNDYSMMVECNKKYSWSFNPSSWKLPIDINNGSSWPVSRTSQLAQWMNEKGWSIPLDSEFSHVEPGDIIFWAKKDESNNFLQPNRYMNISHAAICVDVFDAPDNYPLQYPIKHTVLEATSVAPYILNRSLELCEPDKIVMVCRPDLGSINNDNRPLDLNKEFDIVNIDNVFIAGTYSLNEMMTEGFPEDILSGDGFVLDIVRTISEQGNVQALQQKLVNAKDMSSFFMRTQYCGDKIPDSLSWTPWIKFSTSKDVDSIRQDLESYATKEHVAQAIKEAQFDEQSLDLSAYAKIEEHINPLVESDKAINESLEIINTKIGRYEIQAAEFLVELMALVQEKDEIKANVNDNTTAIAELQTSLEEHKNNFEEKVDTACSDIESIKGSIENIIEFETNAEANLKRIDTLEENIQDLTEAKDNILSEVDAINTTINEYDKKFKDIDNDTFITRAAIEINASAIEDIIADQEEHEAANNERIEYIDATVTDFEGRIKAAEANLLTIKQTADANAETIATALATIELVKQLKIDTRLNADGFIEVDLMLADEILSSVVLPYDTDFEEKIARVDTARVDYSKVL